jgi:PKD repeat protein
VSTTYAQTSYTLDPTVEIPDDAAPAIGIDDATAAEIKTASDEQLAVALSYELAGSEVTFTITPIEEPDATYDVEWDFGNGRHETGHDLVQRCTYSPGTYMATATVRRDGKPSADLSATVVV